MFVEKSKRAGGYVLSYGGTAAGYSGYAVEYVVEGAVKCVINCPLAVVGVAMGKVFLGHRNSKDPKSGIKGSKFGKNIYESTGEMRKVDYVPLSQAIRKVAGCFEARGDLQNVSKAKTQLEALKGSDVFSHLPVEEKNEVDAAYDRISKMHGR